MWDQRPHTVLVYRASPRADATLQRVAERVKRAGRLTVVALAVEEPASRCCDTRSVLWNRYQREFARENLERARNAIPGVAGVEFDVLAHPARRAAEAVLADATRREADEIVIADLRTAGLSRRDRRLLSAQGDAVYVRLDDGTGARHTLPISPS